jgi:hypothetical protein
VQRWQNSWKNAELTHNIYDSWNCACSIQLFHEMYISGNRSLCWTLRTPRWPTDVRWGVQSQFFIYLQDFFLFFLLLSPHFVNPYVEGRYVPIDVSVPVEMISVRYLSKSFEENKIFLLVMPSVHIDRYQFIPVSPNFCRRLLLSITVPYYKSSLMVGNLYR